MMIPGFGFDSIITIQRQLDLISILRRIITLASISQQVVLNTATYYPFVFAHY